MEERKSISEALSRVHEVIQGREGIHVIHTSEVSRKDRELLLRGEWLQEICKGWYLLVRPDLRPGDSSGWYAIFWDFLSVYLHHFYGEDYCLSAEHSLDLHMGKTVVPKQVIVMATKGRGSVLELPFGTSLMVYAASNLLEEEKTVVNRLQVMTLPYALCRVTPTFFERASTEGEIALLSVKSADALLRVLLRHNFVRAAGRLVGGYRALGRLEMVEALEKGLALGGMSYHEVNPFPEQRPLFSSEKACSPYVARIKVLWSHFRTAVIDNFPTPPGLPVDEQRYMERVDRQHTEDAYHSLSIEGYQVSAQLIEKVESGQWSPEGDVQDRSQRDAFAARGYFEAFQAVRTSLEKALRGANGGDVAAKELAGWYQKLFAPTVSAGILEAADLFGYRQHQVYIRNSRHTPLPAHALLDAMEALFTCLKEEAHGGVRAVLGHFFFVYIHPYMDGNGRLGRFLMNVMLASGGYPWTIVRVEHRTPYLAALEAASCEQNIIPFTLFLREELSSSDH